MNLIIRCMINKCDAPRRCVALGNKIRQHNPNTRRNRYDHTGAFFDVHNGVLHVKGESHFHHLRQNIHAIPVKDGCVRKLEEWLFANYSELIGRRKGTLVDRDFAERYFFIARRGSGICVEFREHLAN